MLASPRRAIRSPAFHGALVAFMALVYAALFSYLSILEHDTFSSNAFDLGNMDQAVWNTLHGSLLRFTNYEGVDTRLAVHVEPILIPISLLYLLYSNPKSLLVLQSVVVSLGAVPIYWQGRSQLHNPWLALTFPLVYLLFPALEAANMFDFHAVTLSAAFLAYACWFMGQRRYPWFLAFALLALSTKEEVSLIVVTMGIYIAVAQRAWRWGGAVAMAGAAWFYLAVYVILPYFNPMGASPYLGYYAYLGPNPLETASGALTQLSPWLERLDFGLLGGYLTSLMGPTAFLSALSPHILLLSFSSLALNLLSENPLMHLPNTFHYAAPIVPFAVMASIAGVRLLSGIIGRTSPRRKEVAAVALCSLMLATTLVYHRLHGFSPLSQNFVLKEVTDHNRKGDDLIRLIPPDAALSTDFSTNPHVSQRSRLYVFPRIEDADYVLLDVTGPSLPLTAREVRDTVLGLLESGEFGVRAADDGFLLLKRGLSEAWRIPDEFYSFARARDVPSTARLFTGWEGAPQGLAFDYRFTKYPIERYKMPVITMCWLLPPDRRLDFSLKLLATDRSGEVLWEGFDKAPAAIWYSPEHWQAGELVKVEAPPLSLGRPWSDIPGLPTCLHLEVASTENPSLVLPLLNVRLEMGSISIGDPIQEVEPWPAEDGDFPERLQL